MREIDFTLIKIDLEEMKMEMEIDLLVEDKVRMLWKQV